MDATDPQILKLTERVLAASDEFRTAIALHEAWKPAAFDAEVHKQLGRSFAANTFVTIRAALRREMLLALMRIWDADSRTVSMESIANTLKDGRVVDALARQCEQDWEELHDGGLVGGPKTPEEEEAVRDLVRSSGQAFGKERSAELRENVQEVVGTITRYGAAGDRHAVLERLRTLRNKFLAHRDLNRPAVESLMFSRDDEEIEQFYADNARAIHLLRLVVQNTHYDPLETAAVFGKHARLFWAGVRGEMTEGHPFFVSRPSAR